MVEASGEVICGYAICSGWGCRVAIVALRVRVQVGHVVAAAMGRVAVVMKLRSVGARSAPGETR